MRTLQLSLAWLLPWTFAVPAVGLAENPAYLQLEGANLAQGRTIWLGTCEGCHGYGTAGAPIPMEKDDWKDRLKKPQSLLYQHAIEGFYGPDDTMMPARGGNTKLSDADVKAAVDYMTALAKHYQQFSAKP